MALHAAQPAGALKAADIQHVTVDTTVQEKAIAFPTDARLAHKARAAPVRATKRAGLQLRQTYARESRRLLQRQGRYCLCPAVQARRTLHPPLAGAVRPRHPRCRTQMPAPTEALADLLARVKRIYT